jgi:hypothetical protein
MHVATSSAQAPCPYVRCDFPIFSPAATTMRFQPIVVPRPSANETATFTQSGLNFVTPSSDCLLLLSEAAASSGSSEGYRPAVREKPQQVETAGEDDGYPRGQRVREMTVATAFAVS